MTFFFFLLLNPVEYLQKQTKVLVSSLLSYFLLQADLPKVDYLHVCMCCPKKVCKRIPRVKPKEFLTDLRNVTLTLCFLLLSVTNTYSLHEQNNLCGVLDRFKRGIRDKETWTSKQWGRRAYLWSKGGMNTHQCIWSYPQGLIICTHWDVGFQQSNRDS